MGDLGSVSTRVDQPSINWKQGNPESRTVEISGNATLHLWEVASAPHPVTIRQNFQKAGSEQKNAIVEQAKEVALIGLAGRLSDTLLSAVPGDKLEAAAEFVESNEDISRKLASLLTGDVGSVEIPYKARLEIGVPLQSVSLGRRSGAAAGF